MTPNFHKREGVAVNQSPQLCCFLLLLVTFLAPSLTAQTRPSAAQSTKATQHSITPAQLAEAESSFDRAMIFKSTFSSEPQENLGIFLQAADQGSAAAKRDLGLVYRSNDAEQALQWFEAAAIGGDIRASSYVGDFYVDPKNGTPDSKLAQYWYEKSYNARDARGTIALAMLSCNGIGRKVNDVACGKLLDDAHNFQEPTDPYDVMLNLAADDFSLGTAYQHGKGVPRNLKAAASWYAKAAAQGSVPGAVAESKLYIEGGLPQNLPLATSILDAVVPLANKTRLCNGEKYLGGNGSPNSSTPNCFNFAGQDTVAATYIEIGAKYEARGSAGMSQAFSAYKSAATLGNGVPAVALTVRYANGKGVAKNLDTAYTMMMQLAALNMSMTSGRMELSVALNDLAADYVATNDRSNAGRIMELRHAAGIEKLPVSEALSVVPAADSLMVERYPNLSAPDTVQTAQEFAVNVSLDAFQIDKNTNIMSGQQDNGQLQITLPEGMTSMPIQVDLIAPGMTFLDSTNFSTLILDSTQQSSSPAVFRLRAASAPANGILVATLSYHGNSIARLSRSIAIVAATTDTTPSNTVAQKPPIVSQLPPDTTNTPPNTNATTRSDNTPIGTQKPISPKLLTLNSPVPPTPQPPVTKLNPPLPAQKPATPIRLDANAKFADLTIHETLVGDTMVYTFDSPGLNGTKTGTYPGAAGLQAQVQQIYHQLEIEGQKLGGGVGGACAADRAKGGGSDKDDNCAESKNARGLVQGIGTHLYNDLAPSEFRDIYQLLTANKIRIHSITIDSDDPLLPWELMLPDPGTDNFLGLTAAIVREPASNPQLAQPAEVDFTALAVVAPNYSGTLALNTAAEVKILKDDFPQAKETDGDESSVETLIRNAPQGIIHFAGHGKRATSAAAPATATAAPAATSTADTLAPQSAIALVDDDMLPDTFMAFRAEGAQTHPFYFFNACYAGQSDRELNYVTGWAPALMQSGASGYLGALFEVGDDSATQFAKYFYGGLKTNLASSNNWTVAELVTSARKSTYAEANDPTALAYVLYSKPFMKLVSSK